MSSSKEMEGLNNRIATRVAQNALPPLSPRVQSSNKSLIIPLPSSSQESPSSGKDKVILPDSNTEAQVPQERDSDPNADPKKHRRAVASRQYSQKYRLKQLQYIGQLETEFKALQADVAIFSPRIKYGDRQNSLLRAENSSMKQKLSAFSGELLFKQAQYEELKKERDALTLFSEAYQKQVPEMLRSPYGSSYRQLLVNNVGGGLNQITEPTQIYQNLNQFTPVGGGLQFINTTNALKPNSYNNNFM